VRTQHTGYSYQLERDAVNGEPLGLSDAVKHQLCTIAINRK